MGKIPTYPHPLAKTLSGRASGPGLQVIEPKVAINKVADRLDPPVARFDRAEQIPCFVGQHVWEAVSTRQGVDQRGVRKVVGFARLWEGEHWLIDVLGGYFDGHPWAQEASVDVEDPQSPLVAHAAPSFRFTEELYQFRSFSRDRVRVLMTLDTRSVDMTAPGINRTDGDFPLAWAKMYGKGRVFYSSFGHTVEAWDNPQVQKMYVEAIRWSMRLTGDDVKP